MGLLAVGDAVHPRLGLCLSVCLSVTLHTCLSVCHTTYLSVCLSLYVPVCLAQTCASGPAGCWRCCASSLGSLSVRLSVRHATYLSVCLSHYIPVCLSVTLRTCLSSSDTRPWACWLLETLCILAWVSVRPSVCQSRYIPVCLSHYIPVCLSVTLRTCLSSSDTRPWACWLLEMLCILAWVSVRLSVCQSRYIPVCLSVMLHTCLSVTLRTCLSSSDTRPWTCWLLETLCILTWVSVHPSVCQSHYVPVCLAQTRARGLAGCWRRCASSLGSRPAAGPQGRAVCPPCCADSPSPARFSSEPKSPKKSTNWS